MTAKVLRNNCAKRHQDKTFPSYILNMSKLAGSNQAYQISSLQSTPLTRLEGLTVEMYRMKRLLNGLETCTIFIQNKTTEKVGLYTDNALKVTVLKSWTAITLEKEMDKSFIIIQR